MSDPNAPLTIAQALARAATSGVDRLDAHLLLGHVLARSRTWLLAHDTDLVEPEAQTRYLALLARRAEDEPAAYLLGDKEFFGLSLRVTPDTLIPRPDTETLVHWALEHLPTDQPRRGYGTAPPTVQHARSSRRAQRRAERRLGDPVRRGRRPRYRRARACPRRHRARPLRRADR